MTTARPSSPSIEELAKGLLDKIEQCQPDSLAGAVSDTTVQHLLTAAVRLYASKLDDEVVPFPFVGGETLTPTEVGTTVGQMIKAADIDLFELVAWQSLRGN